MAKGVVMWSLVLLTMALLFLVVDARLGCRVGMECLKKISPKDGNKKVTEMAEELFKGFRPLDPAVARSGDLISSDLRWVPSGPDPLHHNGTPKKPKTP